MKWTHMDWIAVAYVLGCVFGAIVGWLIVWLLIR